ncbi:hypothetical protein KAH81_05235, partial [bacterium]|nr:hypothetical protein [bacterium]
MIRDKDISLKLAKLLGIDYETFSKASTGYTGNGIEILKNTAKAISYIRKNNIDIWVSKYGAAHIASWLTRKKSIAFIDDDIELVPLVAWTSFPFAKKIIAPEVTRTGRFDKKTIRFKGNFELFYLHPKRFAPDTAIYNDLGINRNDKFAVIRLSALTAHHDIGKKGISQKLLDGVLDVVKDRMHVFITSEKPLDSKFEEFRMPIPPHKI